MINENLSEAQLDTGVLLRCKGTFATMNVFNDNNHRYKKQNYDAVLAPLLPKISKKALFGALEHKPKTTHEHVDTAIRIDSIEYDEATNSYIGEISIMDTEHGRILFAIAKSGSPIYLSSRALGKVLPSGDVELRKMITFDAVCEAGFGSETPAEFTPINESLATYELDEDDEDNPNTKTQNSQNMTKEEKAEIIEAVTKAVASQIDIDKVVETKLSEVQKSVNETIATSTKTAKDEVLETVSEFIDKSLLKQIEESIDAKMTDKLVTEAKTMTDDAKTEVIATVSDYIENSLMSEIDKKIDEKLVDATPKEVDNVSKYSVGDVIPKELLNSTDSGTIIEIDGVIAQVDFGMGIVKSVNLSEVEEKAAQLKAEPVNESKIGDTVTVEDKAAKIIEFLNDDNSTVRVEFEDGTTKDVEMSDITLVNESEEPTAEEMIGMLIEKNPDKEAKDFEKLSEEELKSAYEALSKPAEVVAQEGDGATVKPQYVFEAQTTDGETIRKELKSGKDVEDLFDTLDEQEVNELDGKTLDKATISLLALDGDEYRETSLDDVKAAQIVNENALAVGENEVAISLSIEDKEKVDKIATPHELTKVVQDGDYLLVITSNIETLDKIKAEFTEAEIKFEDYVAPVTETKEETEEDETVNESVDSLIDELDEIINEAKTENEQGVKRTKYDKEPFVLYRPKQFDHVWESLGDNERAILASQASYRRITTVNEGFKFWSTRDFNELGQPEFVFEGLQDKLDEQKNTQQSFKERVLNSIKVGQGTR